jgi:carboxypeptidase family protein
VARRSPFTLALGAVALLAAGSVALQSATAGRNVQPTTGIVVPQPFTLAVWNADSDNLVPAQGTIVANGTPVSGVRVRVDNYDLPSPTDKNGHFVYLADATLLQRHLVTVTDASAGKAGGRLLSPADRAALTASQASINVAYAVRDLKVSRNGAGQPVVTGRLANTNGSSPPAVGLLTYQLTGTVTDSNGKPVAGAQVSTRTLDRDYWTVSTVTDSSGRYDSLFTASAEVAGNPVPFTVRVSKGDVVYQFLSQEFINFQRLKSAKLDIRLPPRGYAMALPHPQSYPGALYTGTAVGVTSGTISVRPVSATWPDRTGRFSITLPKSLAGKSVSIWEGKLNLFSVANAMPGSEVDLRDWPATLPREVPRDLASIKLK